MMNNLAAMALAFIALTTHGRRRGTSKNQTGGDK
jgi:hypothetical protein